VAEREESIGAHISRLRKDKAMTQKELAERLTAWRRARHLPTARVACLEHRFRPEA
jgi:transcriptional regulator with XRE-family HTH domain